MLEIMHVSCVSIHEHPEKTDCHVVQKSSKKQNSSSKQKKVDFFSSN